MIPVSTNSREECMNPACSLMPALAAGIALAAVLTGVVTTG
jgi:hypothetical protein